MRQIVAILLLLGILTCCTAAAIDVNNYNGWLNLFPDAVRSAATSARIPYQLSQDEQMAWRLGYATGLASSAGLTIETSDQTFIVNINTDKFHKSTCDSIKKITAENRYDFTGSRDLLLALGFAPCKNCKP